MDNLGFWPKCQLKHFWCVMAKLPINYSPVVILLETVPNEPGNMSNTVTVTICKTFSWINFLSKTTTAHYHIVSEYVSRWYFDLVVTEDMSPSTKICRVCYFQKLSEQMLFSIKSSVQQTLFPQHRWGENKSCLYSQHCATNGLVPLLTGIILPISILLISISYVSRVGIWLITDNNY